MTRRRNTQDILPGREAPEAGPEARLATTVSDADGRFRVAWRANLRRRLDGILMCSYVSRRFLMPSNRSVSGMNVAGAPPERGADMRGYLYGFVTFGLFSLASACAPAPLPAVRAAGVEQMQCDATSTAQEGLVRSTKVIAVEPHYTRILTTGSTDERVDGVKLVVRPPPGVTADQMTRILQCHSARALLGQINRDSVRNDPYWLPDRWVNIEVKPENGNFAVTLSADSVRDNLKVLSQANGFASDHALATEPELP